MRLILLPLVFSVAAGAFRNDYEYDSSVDGYFKVHRIPATWHDAWLRCDLEGSVLASPTDAQMKQAMEAQLKTKNFAECAYYTGIHATFSKGDYSSVEGVPLSKMALQWAGGEPDNAGNNENCIIMINGAIADVNCTEVFPYMCFRRNSKDLITTSCGTVDNKYELSPSTGSCYKFHNYGVSWHRAYMTCAAEGGYLAVINSKEEAMHLKRIFEENRSKILSGANTGLIIIGNHNWGEHRVWRTIHGKKLEEAGYAEWENNQPDHDKPGPFCGAMFLNSKLDDYSCDQPAPFICEMIPGSLLNEADNKNLHRLL